jgi:mono/diheme cytochrome c family protein
VNRWPCSALLALGFLCAVPAALAAGDAATAARNNYMLRCMGCHVADGSGSAGRVPSLRDSLVPLAASPAGRRYLVQVPGAAQSPLSDLELAQVLSWMVRTLGRPAAPAGFVDFSASEVTSYRSTPLIDVQATRARLLPAASLGRG